MRRIRIPSLLTALLLLGLAGPGLATTNAPDPDRILMCSEQPPGLPITLEPDQLFKTYTTPERTSEILATLAAVGASVETNPHRRVTLPYPAAVMDRETGHCVKITDMGFAVITEEYNTDPKPGDTWLASIETAAFGQTWTVTREREGDGDRVTDNHGGSRFESHDKQGRVTRVEDDHGEILYVHYYPYGYRPWIRIDGNLFLRTIYPKDGLSDWQTLELYSIADRRVLATWTEESVAPKVAAARLGFLDPVARWDDLHPDGALVVKYHRGGSDHYAYAPLDGKGEVWRAVYLPFQDTRITYTDKQIRLTVRGETLSWRRGEIPK